MLGSTLACNSKNVRQASRHGYFRETLELDVVYGSLSWSFNIAIVSSALVWPPGGTRHVRSNPRPRSLATSPASFLYSASINRWYCAAVGYCSGCTMIRTSPPSAAERVAMMCRGEACLEPRSGFTATWYGVMSPRWTATWVITSHLERSLSK